MGLFDYLRPFSRIIVSGPQRAGTTAATIMIADDLCYKFYLEAQIQTSELGLALELLATESAFVLQAPALCRWVHFCSGPGVAVVMMRRDVQDIIASEKRIKWHDSYHNKLELKRYGLEEGCIAEIKYRYWDEQQKAMTHNAFEIEYESLAAHPMWVPKEQRVNFRTRQYKLDAP